MYTTLTYEVQKAIARERLTNAAASHPLQRCSRGRRPAFRFGSPAMRRIFMVGATLIVLVTAGAGAALAASQSLCLRPGHEVEAPQSDGQCRAGETAVTLASQDELSGLQNEVSALQNQVSSLQSENATLASDVSALKDKLSKVSYSDSGGVPTLTIAGANLQLVNGAARTDTTNGLGNLIIGYNEYPGTQTGSHNLILGRSQTFTSYGGVIAGHDDRLSGPFSAVFGAYDIASGVDSTVSGGVENTASGGGSSVSGGSQNTASGDSSGVSGGYENTASGPGQFASVSGGYGNFATGNASSVSGGVGNKANSQYASILGGVNQSLNGGDPLTYPGGP